MLWYVKTYFINYTTLFSSIIRYLITSWYILSYILYYSILQCNRFFAISFKSAPAGTAIVLVFFKQLCSLCSFLCQCFWQFVRPLVPCFFFGGVFLRFPGLLASPHSSWMQEAASLFNRNYHQLKALVCAMVFDYYIQACSQVPGPKRVVIHQCHSECHNVLLTKMLHVA